MPNPDIRIYVTSGIYFAWFCQFYEKASVYRNAWNEALTSDIITAHVSLIGILRRMKKFFKRKWSLPKVPWWRDVLVCVDPVLGRTDP